MTTHSGRGEPTRTIDTDALRAKYREERDKRIRPDGNQQYVLAGLDTYYRTSGERRSRDLRR